MTLMMTTMMMMMMMMMIGSHEGLFEFLSFLAFRLEHQHG